MLTYLDTYDIRRSMNRESNIEKCVDIGREVTLTERKFLNALEKTLDPTEAAIRACRLRKDAVTSVRQRAHVRASVLMKKLGFKMTDIMDLAGVTDDRIAKKVDKLMEAKDTIVDKMGGEHIINDNTTQYRATELASKLRGHLNQEGRSGTGAMTFNFIVQKVDKVGRPIEAAAVSV